ncbi:MAG: phosphatidylglycerol lysyltransferase domain-containing protein [Vulcanimicrobiota bacterium]
MTASEEFSPNFVSGQCATCGLHTTEAGRYEWNYVRHGGRVVTAGMPTGPDRAQALTIFEDWCRQKGVTPLLFGCELKDLDYLSAWQVTEIGRQPLFKASSDFDHTLSGEHQPESHRKLRRQARRAFSKGVRVRELDVPELWRLSEDGAFDTMMFERWQKRGLADFSFLVEFRIEKGQAERRAFLVEHPESENILGLIFLVPCERGWLLEHQLLATQAPNGTAELVLCELLARHIRKDRLLSLGITPLYQALRGRRGIGPVPTILQALPIAIIQKLLPMWESFYGFRSLLHFREKLEPDEWEPVYWAVPRRRPIRDIWAVLKAFAGGSFSAFAGRTLEKRLHAFALSIRESLLPKVNLFYIATLLVWIPILWNLDSVPLFGNAEACKVWAVYDLLLLALFILHQKVPETGKPSFTTELLLGLVTADTVLAWIQTAMYHGGLPTTQPLGFFVFVINTAPVSALLFLGLVKYATKPVPFRRRDLLRT